MNTSPINPKSMSIRGIACPILVALASVSAARISKAHSAAPAPAPRAVTPVSPSLPATPPADKWLERARLEEGRQHPHLAFQWFARAALSGDPINAPKALRNVTAMQLERARKAAKTKRLVAEARRLLMLNKLLNRAYKEYQHATGAGGIVNEIFRDRRRLKVPAMAEAKLLVLHGDKLRRDAIRWVWHNHYGMEKRALRDVDLANVFYPSYTPSWVVKKITAVRQYEKDHLGSAMYKAQRIKDMLLIDGKINAPAAQAAG